MYNKNLSENWKHIYQLHFSPNQFKTVNLAILSSQSYLSISNKIKKYIE